MDRRTALELMGMAGMAALASPLHAFTADSPETTPVPDPWPPDALLGASTLSNFIAGGDAPVIFCVGFPNLFREKHLPGAVLTGTASKPEGVRELLAKARAANGSQIVLYCGCCPMKECPNIRPAYSALAKHKIQGVQVLNLPHNLHVDWVAKGYPTQSDAS